MYVTKGFISWKGWTILGGWWGGELNGVNLLFNFDILIDKIQGNKSKFSTSCWKFHKSARLQIKARIYSVKNVLLLLQPKAQVSNLIWGFTFRLVLRSRLLSNPKMSSSWGFLKQFIVTSLFTGSFFARFPAVFTVQNFPVYMEFITSL